MPGLEPGSTAWEAAILPLDHIRFPLTYLKEILILRPRCVLFSSVRKESARITPAETVIGRFAMVVVGDNHVTSTLARLVTGDYWPNVLPTRAHFWHA